MKKACGGLLIVVIILMLSGCNIIKPRFFPPEKIVPEVLISGDVDSVVTVDVDLIEKTQFGERQGYPLTSVLSGSTPSGSSYDLLLVARNGKAIMIQYETISSCYFLNNGNGVLEFHSAVHYYFAESFLPLRGVAEIIVISNEEVDNGIALTGGNWSKINTKRQVELIFCEIRTYISNNGYTMREYSKEAVSASKLLFGTASYAEVILLGGPVVDIESDTGEILDWKQGNLVLRSNNLPIIAINLDEG